MSHQVHLPSRGDGGLAADSGDIFGQCAKIDIPAIIMFVINRNFVRTADHEPLYAGSQIRHKHTPAEGVLGLAMLSLFIADHATYAFDITANQIFILIIIFPYCCKVDSSLHGTICFSSSFVSLASPEQFEARTSKILFATILCPRSFAWHPS